MRLPPALALLALAAAPARAQSVPPPVFRVGDTWLVQDTIEKGAAGFAQERLDLTITRLEGDTMAVNIKRDGAPGAGIDVMCGIDWSKRHLVDGESQTTTRPYDFPLRPGKSWSIDYTDATRRGNQLNAHIRRTYTVAGWQDITVPAGTFHVVKIVAKGTEEGHVVVPNTAFSAAASEPGAAGGISRLQRGGIRPLMVQTYEELYYAPNVKNQVKSVAEQYNTDGVRLVRDMQELVAFTPGH